MIGLLQRVVQARVSAEGMPDAVIGAGLAVLVGIERDDDEARAERLLERLLGYRVFNDEAGRMNQSLRAAGGGLLLIPQFTLAADTRKGTRASFQTAASPASAQALFRYLCERAVEAHSPVSWGVFGADMDVTIVNQGPVTFWLQA